MTQFTPALNPAGATARETADRINRLLAGKMNVGGSVTLASGGATSTVISDQNIGLESRLFLTAATASAALMSPSLWIAAKTKGSATLMHSSNAGADVRYDYIVIG